jgi:hypothetical protein
MGGVGDSHRVNGDSPAVRRRNDVFWLLRLLKLLWEIAVAPVYGVGRATSVRN